MYSKKEREREGERCATRFTEAFKVVALLALLACNVLERLCPPWIYDATIFARSSLSLSCASSWIMRGSGSTRRTEKKHSSRDTSTRRGIIFKRPLERKKYVVFFFFFVCSGTPRFLGMKGWLIKSGDEIKVLYWNKTKPRIVLPGWEREIIKQVDFSRYHKSDLFSGRGVLYSLYTARTRESYMYI